MHDSARQAWVAGDCLGEETPVLLHGRACHDAPFTIRLSIALQLSVLLLLKTGNDPSKYFTSKCVGDGCIFGSTCFPSWACGEGCIALILPWRGPVVEGCFARPPCMTMPRQRPPPTRSPPRSAVLTSNILAQTEILTFVLFWTLTNNIVYLF